MVLGQNAGNALQRGELISRKYCKLPGKRLGQCYFELFHRESRSNARLSRVENGTNWNGNMVGSVCTSGTAESKYNEVLTTQKTGYDRF